MRGISQILIQLNHVLSMDPEMWQLSEKSPNYFASSIYPHGFVWFQKMLTSHCQQRLQQL